MIYEIYVTKDTVKGQTDSPFYFRNNENEAKRAWGGAIKQLRANNQENVPIDDLQLWKVGTFNVQTLEFKSDIQFICSGSEF